jgi:hypothetical protein
LGSLILYLIYKTNKVIKITQLTKLSNKNVRAQKHCILEYVTDFINLYQESKNTFAVFSSCDYKTEIKTVFVSKVLKLLFSFDLFFSVLLNAVNDSKT